MMGQKASQDQLFYAFNLADHIPRDHLLRGVDRFLERVMNFEKFSFVTSTYERFCKNENREILQ